MNQTSQAVLQTKPHFHILDGLRGVAALAIVIFHFMEWIYIDPGKNFIGHGFLAVDFFFCLSGFVVAYAYDDRMQKLGLKEFFKLRLIRLHPLVFLGAVLGLLGFLFDPNTDSSGLYSAGWLAFLFLSTALLIPMPLMEDRAFNLFGLNPPSWSLFWEYVANIVYALLLVRLARKYLVVLLVAAAGALLFISYQAGNLLGGWNGDTFWHGGIRISFSFLAGLLVYRSNLIIKNRLGFLGLAALLMLPFLMPHFELNWLVEALIVLLYFPLIVSLGAGASLSPAMKKICIFSGNLSYPLYMTHYAGISFFGSYLTKYEPAGTELTIIVIGGTLFLVMTGWLAMVFYDIPLRKYLKRLQIRQQSVKP